MDATEFVVRSVYRASSTRRPDEVETALLGLESIDACEVSRTAAGSADQHVWAVTFLEVSWHTCGLLENDGIATRTCHGSKIAIKWFESRVVSRL